MQAIGKDNWPKCGGANASIRFDPEITHGANAGLTGALSLLEALSAKYPEVSSADMYQLASATAIEVRRATTSTTWRVQNSVCVCVVRPSTLVCGGLRLCLWRLERVTYSSSCFGQLSFYVSASLD